MNQIDFGGHFSRAGRVNMNFVGFVLTNGMVMVTIVLKIKEKIVQNNHKLGN